MSISFDLTKSLLNDILEAMENRNDRFVVAVTDAGVEVRSAWREPPSADGKVTGYPLPEWTSDEGYALRCDFVRRLHAPIAREALEEALHSGRGAFRAFKDAIKPYPHVERLWHRYKRQHMADIVWAWYDALCDEWGLEHLERTLDDEGSKTSDLLREDFDFAPFASSDMADAKLAIATEMQDTPLPRDAAAALVFRYCRQMAECTQGVAVRTIDGIFVGCITWETDSDNSAAFLTSIVVAKEWRGLGIASALLEECMARCTAGYAVCALPVTNDALEALLQKAMFQRVGALWWKSTSD